MCTDVLMNDYVGRGKETFTYMYKECKHYIRQLRKSGVVEHCLPLPGLSWNGISLTSSFSASHSRTTTLKKRQISSWGHDGGPVSCKGHVHLVHDLLQMNFSSSHRI